MKTLKKFIATISVICVFSAFATPAMAENSGWLYIESILFDVDAGSTTIKVYLQGDALVNSASWKYSSTNLEELKFYESALLTAQSTKREVYIWSNNTTDSAVDHIILSLKMR